MSLPHGGGSKRGECVRVYLRLSENRLYKVVKPSQWNYESNVRQQQSLDSLGTLLCVEMRTRYFTAG